MRPQAQQSSANSAYAAKAVFSQATLHFIVGAAIHQNSSDRDSRLVSPNATGWRLKSAVESFQNVQQDADRRLPPGGNPRRRRSR